MSAATALQEFNVTPDDAGVDKKSGKYCYWKADNGYIVVGPAWPTEMERQRDKGMEPLKKYGQFALYNAETKWRVLNEPYRQIFQRGGAAEFPLEQVIEHNWHRKPPYKGVIFPQLKGYQATDVRCRCGRWFSSEELLQKHQSVMHREDGQQRSLAQNLAEAMKQVQGPLGDVLKLLVEQQAQQAKMLADILQEKKK